MSRYFSLIILALFIPAILSCRRATVELPVMPASTHPLLREYVGYGVVNASFIHLLTEAGQEGVSQGYLRRGTVVRIIERRPVFNRGSSELWVYAVGNYRQPSESLRGWLRESTLIIFDNESRALTASRSMTN